MDKKSKVRASEQKGPLQEMLRLWTKKVGLGLQATQLIPEPAQAGPAGTSSLANYLKQLLPTRYSIDTNAFVVAHDGSMSDEQDIVLYDGFGCPPFLAGEMTKIYPVEAIYAVFEVKTTLTASQVRDGVEKIHSVKKLPKLAGTHTFGGLARRGITAAPVGVIFGYRARKNSLHKLCEALAKSIEHIPAHQVPNVMCVLQPPTSIYHVIPEQRKLVFEPTSDSEVRHLNGELALAHFITTLWRYLTGVTTFIPDFHSYLFG